MRVYAWNETDGARNWQSWQNVVVATTSILIDFKLSFDRDTRVFVIPFTILLPDFFWKRTNTTSQKNCHNLAMQLATEIPRFVFILYCSEVASTSFGALTFLGFENFW